MFATSEAQTKVEIKFIGVEDAVLLDNIRARLDIASIPTKATPARVQYLNDQAPKQIKQALEPFGYYQAKVVSTLNEMSPDNWTATYQIELGKPMLVTQLDIKVEGPGKTDSDFQTLLDKIPLKQGQPLLHKDYEATKNQLIALAADNGYFDAELIEHKIEISLEKYEAYIHIHLNTGPRYRFGKVTFKDAKLSDELLNRYLTFREGDPYELTKLTQLQNDLSSSDYFSLVNVQPQPEHANEKLEVPILVTFVPQKRSRYQIGLGYATDTGPRTTLKYTRRRVNNYGHKIESVVQWSPIALGGEVLYIVPGKKPVTDQYIYGVSRFNDDLKSYDNQLSKVRFDAVAQKGVWQRTLGLSFQHEDYDIADTHAITNYIVPGVRFLRLWNYDHFNITPGKKFANSFVVDLRGGIGTFDEVPFAQSQVQNKFLLPLTSKTRLIHYNVAAGTAVQNIEDLPPSIRFFVGGEQRVRGYDYLSTGPRNDRGQVIGGTYFYMTSIELDQKIIGNWGVAGFYDAGTAFNNIEEPVRQGAGFGLRWFSPLGVLRADMAWGIGEEKAGPIFYLNIGPEL